MKRLILLALSAMMVLACTLPAQSTKLHYFAILRHPADSTVVIQKLKAIPGTDSIKVRTTMMYFVGTDSLNTLLNADFLAPYAVGQLDRATILHTAPVNDTSTGGGHLLSTTDWGLTDMHAPDAWALGITGAGVTVMDLDTGFGPNTGVNAVTGKVFQVSKPDTSDFTDDVTGCTGHGTHTSGTIAGNLASGVGVAPDAKLFMAKVFENDGSGCVAWLSSQINAINYAQTQHIRVLSISIGNSPSSTFEYTIKTIRAANMILCGAMGNSGNATATEPGDAIGAVGVASIGSTDSHSSFSQYPARSATSAGAFISGPGENIVSLKPGGGTQTMSGTSMATPHCAGEVALLLQANPNLTADELTNEMAATSDDLGTAGWDVYYGYGKLRADRAVYAILHPAFIAPVTSVSDQVNSTDSVLVTSSGLWRAWSNNAHVVTVQHGNWLLWQIDSLATKGSTATIRFGQVLN